MPRKSKIVPLSIPFSIHGKTYTEIVLLEPTARQFIEIGPLTTNFMKSGVIATHDLEGVLLSYLASGCASNIDPTVIDIMLGDLSLADGIRLRRIFASFFDEALDLVLLEEATAAAASRPAAVA